ncbi:MAG: methyltransferase domain-containing protein, partial [Vicinamibacterales bacterium]
MTRSLAIRAWCTSVVAAIGAVTAFSVVAQQATGVHPISGRRYAAVMDARGAEWLDRKERETEENPDEALGIIGIKKGTSVADIGAGSGYMTLRLSKRVGSNGVVYASDIQQPMLDILDKRLKSSRI